MGYFSNGTQGMLYQDQYCNRCVHDKNGDCAVWLAHLVANYDECNKPESILHILIPKTEGPEWNGQCKMFIEDEHAEDPRQEKLL